MEIAISAGISLLVGIAASYFLFESKSRQRFASKDGELSEASRQVLTLREQIESIRKVLLDQRQETDRAKEDVTVLRVEVATQANSMGHLQKEKSDAISEVARAKLENKTITAELTGIRERVVALETSNKNFEGSKQVYIAESKQKIMDLGAKVDQLHNDKKKLSEELAALKEQEPIRQAEHGKVVDRLNIAHMNLEKDRANDLAAKEIAETQRLQLLRETWSRHENEVEQKMRLICQQLSIEYVDKEKFPFSGKPDNSVKICGEYIVFDSKSPQGADLNNFPTYIRTQAEAAKKYAKNEEVKKDVYLVVPINAIGELKETYLALGNYRVHVITTDGLQPILRHLQSIEAYEFAEKLSPEDRERIVTTIGKMAHGMKRRVQMDYFMANEFISILTDAENLPVEILKGAQAVEQASKLNPTQEKRGKRISTDDLSKEGQKLLGKVSAQQINTASGLEAIEAIPLHKSESEGE